MIPRFQRWIDANVPARPGGLCRMVSAAMAHKFPELSAVEGLVQFDEPDPANPGELHFVARSHSWCVTEDGAIVDATAEQFKAIGSMSYIPNGPLPEDGEGATQALPWARRVWGTRQVSEHARSEA